MTWKGLKIQFAVIVLYEFFTYMCSEIYKKK